MGTAWLLPSQEVRESGVFSDEQNVWMHTLSNHIVPCFCRFFSTVEYELERDTALSASHQQHQQPGTASVAYSRTVLPAWRFSHSISSVTEFTIRLPARYLRGGQPRFRRGLCV